VALAAVQLVLNYGNAQASLGETALREICNRAAADYNNVERLFDEGRRVVTLGVDINASRRHVDMSD
jgi:hypothetical protein